MAKTNWFWWLLLAGWMCAGSWWHMCHVKQLCVSVAVAQALPRPAFTGLVVRDGGKLVLESSGNILFPISRPEADLSFVKREIDSLAIYLKENSQRKVEVTGSYGLTEHNNTAFENLGEARADQIRKYLISAGVSDAQIAIKGQAVKELDLTGDSLVGGARFDFKPTGARPLPEMLVTGQPEVDFKPVELRFQTGSDVYLPAPDAGDFIGRAKQFLANGDKTLSIYGHADNSGNAQANMDLSLARAERVKKQLVSAGIPASQLVVKAMGQQAPQASNNTPVGRAQNRRVSIVAE